VNRPHLKISPRTRNLLRIARSTSAGWFSHYQGDSTALNQFNRKTRNKLN
jgi:hypothetical protein